MKKVLIVGGSYFIGRKIVDVMLDNGYDVSTLNRGTKPCHNNKIHHIICDRNNAQQMRAALSDKIFDIVVDVSGLNQSQSSILYESLAPDTISKFVFISSSAVYDIDHITSPFKETDRICENTLWTFYGKDKIEAEQNYIEKFKNEKTNLIFLRPPYVYGENNYAQRESFIFEHIFNNKPVLIPASNCKLQFIYTLDLANIIISLIENSDNSKVSVYNVGNKNTVNAREWVECCAYALKKSAEIIPYDHQRSGRNVRDFFPFFDYDNVLDVSKINKIYTAETPFEYGLNKSYEWYLANKNSIIFKDTVTKNEQAILRELGRL